MDDWQKAVRLIRRWIAKRQRIEGGKQADKNLVDFLSEEISP